MRFFSRGRGQRGYGATGLLQVAKGAGGARV